MSTTLRLRTRLPRLIAVLAVGAVLGSTPLPASADEVPAPATTGMSSGGPTAESPVPDTTDPVPPEPTDPAPPVAGTPSAEPSEPSEPSEPDESVESDESDESDEPDPVEEQPGSTPPPTAEPTTPPSTGTPAVAEANVTVTAALQDPDRRYRMGDKVPIILTVTNVGDRAAVEVRGNSTGDVQVLDGWGALSRPGLRLDPGESRTVTVTGTVLRGSGEARSYISIWWWPEGMPPQEPWAMPPTYTTGTSLSVPVVPLQERYPVSGVLFGDRDGDGVFDPGEGLAGVTMSLYVPVIVGSYSAELTTDQEGRFSGELPPGLYRVRIVVGPDGWIVRVPPIVVGGAEPATDLQLQAERPLTEVLDVSAEFLSDRYEISDIPRIRITLTNRGSTTLTGIRALCGRDTPLPWGLGLQGTSEPAHWGALVQDGVTVAAGQTLVLEVTGMIPMASARDGLVYIACSLGPDWEDRTGYPTVFTSAPVAQIPEIVTWGYVYRDWNSNGRWDYGEGVTDLELGLVDPASGEVVATAVSDTWGRVYFTGVLSGLYEARAFAPWRLVQSQVWIGAGKSAWQLQVEPDPEQPGTDPEQPGADPEQPGTDPEQPGADPEQPGTDPEQPGTDPVTPQQTGGLAFTGADVIGWSVLGLALVTGGSLAILVGRRRRDTA
ncbi:MAG TPA: hypothetical protein VIL00_13870 [Pseudonocardiaceae bacterium]